MIAQSVFPRRADGCAAQLILNVDGCIAVCFVDLLRDSGAFTREEADEYIKIGCLNGLFVLGRSIGFIGHHLDQKRLKAPLYRHPGESLRCLFERNSNPSSQPTTSSSTCCPSRSPEYWAPCSRLSPPSSHLPPFAQ